MLLKPKPNTQILLEYLGDGNTITTRNAPDELGMADVRAVIRDLRNMGFDIKGRWVEGVNRYGKKTRYKEYFIDEREGD